MTDVSVAPARPWGAVLLGFLLTQVALVACAYLWVFIYATFIDSSGDAAYYEAYAQVASPVVAVVMAFPVFWLTGRVMRRYGAQARWAALAVVLVNLGVDAVVVATLALDVAYNVGMSLVAAAGKVAGAWVGSRTA
jgi:hypothetical protein